MNILVINGSPKGDNSITLHTCLFLEKRFPEHRFTYLNVGQRIKALEKDFLPAEEALRAADHKFFKPHGQYDFPQKKWKTSWMMYLVGWLMNNPTMRKKAGGKMSEGMIAPYKKILNDK